MMNRRLKHLLFLLILFLCSPSPLLWAGILKGTAYPLYLKIPKTEFNLQDYVGDCSLVDSVTFHPGIVKIPSNNTCNYILISAIPKLPYVSEMKLWSKGTYESVPVFRARKETRPVFLDARNKTYQSVSIVGDFNNWNPKTNVMNHAGERWFAALFLNPGMYSYQFVADGKWMMDPMNKDSVSNGMGGYNSVLRVGKSPEAFPHISLLEAQGKSLRIGSLQNRMPDTLLVWMDNRYVQGCVTKNSKDFTVTIPESSGPGLHKLRIYCYNSSGAGNDLLLWLRDRKIDVSAYAGTEQSMVMYFALTDRFLDGNKGNTKKTDDKEIDDRANFMGGDLAGLTQKIKDGYLSNLGINTIWISPVAQNPEKGYVEFPEPHRKFSSYHGYWPISGTRIDPRFGTPAEFTELVKLAHQKGIKVLLDFVSNHVHEDHPLYKQHKEWTTSVNLKDGRKNIRLWDEERITTWFDTFLPDLDYSKPEVVQAMADTAAWWIKTYDLDGFRHDATKHVPENFWRALTQKLRKDFPEKKLFQIGETFGSRELIATYVNQGEQDAQFDFNTYFDARSFFATENESSARIKNSLQETFAWYGSHHLMGNISGNHDLPRFISYASGALSFKDDDKKAAWDRKIEVKDTLGYYRLMQLHAFNFTIPGIPVLYYGDEIGMPGANDPDNRRMMRFDSLNTQEKRVMRSVSELSQLRAKTPALLGGETLMLNTPEPTELCYARQLGDDIVVIAFNKKSSFQSVQMALPDAWKNLKAESLMQGKAMVLDGKLVSGIKACGFDIIRLVK
jgi:glycosidase